MDSKVSKRSLTTVAAVIFILMAALVFTGMSHTDNTQIGRYRMSVVIRNNFTDIFVIDTTTGVVKYVGQDEGKPFEQIKGK